MKLKFTGPRMITRRVGEVEWSPANQFIAEVPVAMAADLLTEPDDNFELVEASNQELAEMGKLLGVTTAKIRQQFGKRLPIKPSASAAEIISSKTVRRPRRGKKTLEVQDE